jgi:putative tributyrin esterase
MKKLLIIIACFISFATTTQAQEQLLFPNLSYIPGTDTTWVFMPKEYATSPDKKYPAVIMLHGWSGNYKQWHQIINCQLYANAYGFIVICPDGFNDSWYINAPLKPTSQMEEFMFKDLIPTVKQKYRIKPNNLFITGLSMGGHGALSLFAKKPEEFKAVGSTSGLMDLKIAADKYGLTNLLGFPSQSPDTWQRASVLGNVEKIARADKEIIFDCGMDDDFYGVNNELRRRCDELKIKATYISQPGKHDRTYWKRSIKAHFEFFKRLSE